MSTIHVEYIASEERGITQSDWLNSKHTYSFGQYYNLKRLNFGTLRVFNDDVIQGGKGFGMHPHDNMEIVTIVLDGAVAHEDSMGNKGVIKVGEVQRMTAGTGVRHSERNASQDEPAHLLQIWVYPEKRGLEPSYEQKAFAQESFKNTLYPIVSGTPSETSLFIHQDAIFYLGHFDAKQTIKHSPRLRKHGDYVFVIEGEVKLGDQVLKTGDSAQVTEVDHFEMKTKSPAKILLIEVGINTL